MLTKMRKTMLGARSLDVGNPPTSCQSKAARTLIPGKTYR